MSDYKLEPAFGGGKYVSPQQGPNWSARALELEADNARLRAALREIEEYEYNCPWPHCTGEWELKPHKPDCPFAALTAPVYSKPSTVNDGAEPHRNHSEPHSGPIDAPKEEGR
jgi:hypothetical protein